LLSDNLQVVFNDCERLSVVPTLKIEGLVVRAVGMDP
jgi:hypothetical protein